MTSSYISTWYFLHPTCTYGTCSYSSVTLVIHHKSLCSIISPHDVYLWDPSPSDVYLWDLQLLIRDACNSPQKSSLSPFSIRRVPMGPFSIRPMGPDGLCVTCTYETILHLHPTYGT